MLSIFNRREVLLTRDAKAQLRACSLLDGAGIENYTVVGSPGGGRSFHGLPGLHYESLYEYRVFVRKRDYDLAMQALRAKP